MSLPTGVSRLAQYDASEFVQSQFDTLLGRLLGGRETGAVANWNPYGIDVREDNDHLYVEAEMPGFRKEDVNITLENSVLTITAERKEQNGQNASKKGEWLLRERRFNRVHRSFTLPRALNENAVKAALNDGVLTITLDKREESKPRKVTVN